MSFAVSGYQSLHVPVNTRELLTKATQKFHEVLGIIEDKDYCGRLKNLEEEHIRWSNVAKEALKKDEENTSKSAQKRMSWVWPFMKEAAFAGLATQGLISLLPIKFPLDRKICFVASLVIGVLYGISALPKENHQNNVSEDLKLRANAEFEWIQAKLTWLAKVLAEAHIDLDKIINDSDREEKNKEIFQLTTLQTYFKGIERNRYLF